MDRPIKRAEVRFAIDGSTEVLTVYTTRPDTLFGATYMVVAPEHPLLDQLVIAEKKDEVDAYVLSAAKKSDLDRTDLAKDKSGVFTGSYCINPVNGEKIPVWVADYVLISYGTGAIMAVPAHDERDFEFAEKFGIEIRQVISRPDGDEEKGKLPYSDQGSWLTLVNMTACKPIPANPKLSTELEAKDVGKGAVNYKLRDWIFLAPAILGEPIPLVWVSLDDYEKAKATDGVLKDLIPENAVTTDKDDEILYALPLPPANFLSNFPKLKIINPQEPVKVHLQLFQNGWIFGSIWRRGNPLPEPSQSPMERIGYRQPERPIPCPNGQGPAGTTCDILIPKTQFA